MKQCPLCHHTYPDDLNFCLEDGRFLQADRTSPSDEVTERYPQPDPTVRPPEPGPTVPFPTPLDPTIPAPPPPPVPNPPAPQTATPVKRWPLRSVIGTIVIVLLWTTFKLAVWSMDKGDRSAQSKSPVVSRQPQLWPELKLSLWYRGLQQPDADAAT